ncbi:RNA polymerase-associated protein RapA [Formosa haliotis]|uniref:RNA polymerase-associated protein RapA n=1 Tax=Formosa haliotis TaxID=1555194 RepID=UPI00082576DA|nr:RNA polymerase-associated protein RapA [Formosa haliotis]
MHIFFPSQRYTSKGEPELGVGILTEATKGKVKIYFPLADVTRLYATESAPLQRVIFKIGDTIKNLKDEPLLITKVEIDKNLYKYHGKGTTISESELGDVSVNHGVDDRLFMGDVDSPLAFALRRETLELEYKRRLSPVCGFVGGRIDLIPHQLYIAHEVSSRYAPRVLLSDQVGLGKTIEACLILHRLLLSGRISRVLILVPESLVHQWFVEVLRRFNMWFNIFNEERCASLDDNAPDGNPFLDNQLIICSTAFLAGSEKRSQQALSANWDMLVVDEAHNLEWSATQSSPEYSIVERLSQVAQGLLLLTATPEQLGLESHFARLRLLDPNRYENYDDFINESSNQKDIAQIVETLDQGKKLNTKAMKRLESIFSKEKLQDIIKGNNFDNIIENLLDQHGSGRVLFRNTRTTISGFPKRKAKLIPLEVTTDKTLWSSRLKDEFFHDMQPKEATSAQKFWFNKDPRVQWLLTMLKDVTPAKVLLICKSKEKVLALEQALTKRSSIKVAVFHEDLTIVQRDRYAAWFSEPDGAQILLCSEIGSEGRNFQFAHHLVLFDLPLHPKLLEQRIGRLDRIGQVETIQIHVPYLVDSPQEILVKWYHEGLNAFENNIEGGHKISKTFSQRLLELSKSDPNSAKNSKLKLLISETANYQKELQKTLADGRDRLLEMNSFRPKIASKLVEQIQSEDKDKRLEQYLTKVFRHFDIEMEDLVSKTYYLKPTSINTEIFPSIPPEGVGVTFSRTHALSREDLNFLSWDHPMTTDAIDLVLSSGTGSASYAVFKGSKNQGLLLELIFVLETASQSNSYVDRFLPNTPLRVVVNHTGKNVTTEFPVELLDKNLVSGQIDPLLDNETLMDTIIPQMISMATKITEIQRKEAIEDGLERMNNTLNHEIDRLMILKEKNSNIRLEEIEIARNAQLTLETLIKDARLRMDAIQLIRLE